MEQPLGPQNTSDVHFHPLKATTFLLKGLPKLLQARNNSQSLFQDMARLGKAVKLLW